MLCNHVSASTDGLCYWRSKTRGVTRVKKYRWNGFRNEALASIRRVERLGDYLVPSCVLHWLIFRQPCHRTCIFFFFFFCLLGAKRKGISWNPKLFRVLSVGLSRGGASLMYSREGTRDISPHPPPTWPCPRPVLWQLELSILGICWVSKHVPFTPLASPKMYPSKRETLLPPFPHPHSWQRHPAVCFRLQPRIHGFYWHRLAWVSD